MKLHGVKIKEKPLANKLKSGEKRRSNDTNLKGYPGLTHTASQIADFIPKCHTFVEPFAGLGRISKLVKAENYVLNDLSDYAVTFLEKNFNRSNVQITQQDYKICIQENNHSNAYNFIDCPWFDQIYSKNNLSICTAAPVHYYKNLKKIVKTLKGDWMIAGSVVGPLLEWDYFHHEVKSRTPAIFGKYAKTHLVSNKPFKRTTPSLDDYGGAGRREIN